VKPGGSSELKGAVDLELGALDLKAVSTFVLRFVLVLGLFFLPLPVIGQTYAGAFSNVATLVAPRTLRDGAVSLRFAGSAPSKPWEVVMAAEDRVARRKISVPIETRSLSYVPLSVFVALALATPVADPRRERRILGFGLLTMLVLVGVLIAAPLLLLLGGASQVRGFELSVGTKVFLELVHRALVSPPGMAFAVPGLVWWALVSWTRRSS
jgi:hypothetical protein